MTTVIDGHTMNRIEHRTGEVIDRAISEAGHPPLGPLQRIQLVEDLIDAHHGELARAQVVLIAAPDEDLIDAGLLVLPGGAVIDAITHPVDEWTWVYVPVTGGTAAASDIADRLLLVPTRLHRWRRRYRAARHRAARAWTHSAPAELLRDIAAATVTLWDWFRFGDRPDLQPVRDHTAAAVWRLAAVTGHRFPTVARLFDRIATGLDNDHEDKW